jgi:hypothetical protein
MTIDDRKRIDFLLQLGWTPTEIANDRGRNKSTIINEIINRSVLCTKGFGCSNRICAYYDTCTLRVLNKDKELVLRKNMPRCFKDCPEHREATCDYLAVKSHVCNGCEKFKTCALMKRIYVAEGAQAKRESLLHDSRTGIHPTDKDIKSMNEVLSPCILKGQSVRNVIVNNPDKFKGISERTVYDYIAGGLFDAKRGDLPEACGRRQRRKRKETKSKAKCRVGRDYKTFIEFCRANNVTEWTELDTVIGKVGGKVLFTMFLPGNIMIAFLREKKNTTTCTRLFNELWKLAGPDLFQKLFFVILTDNGTEFSDAKMIESFRPTPNTTPIGLSRGASTCSTATPTAPRRSPMWSANTARSAGSSRTASRSTRSPRMTSTSSARMSPATRAASSTTGRPTMSSWRSSARTARHSSTSWASSGSPATRSRSTPCSSARNSSAGLTW